MHAIGATGSAMRRTVAASLRGCVLLLAACTAAEQGDEATPDRHADEAAATDSAAAVCLLGGSFAFDGAIATGSAEAGDGRRIGELRWSAHDGCERFVIGLLAEDGRAARRAGAVTAEVMRDLGVVRVTMREVETADPTATEAVMDGDLAASAYVVWSPEGRWTYVDVHLASPAEARVSTLDDPARVVVDLRPGGDAVPERAPRAERVVVLQPREGSTTYPLTVTGYARTFEANVVVRLEQQGRDVLQAFTTATAWVDAWGHYSLTIADGPTGPTILHVGEHSARDGTWEGVAIRLHLR
jgi:hypothetical protein